MRSRPNPRSPPAKLNAVDASASTDPDDGIASYLWQQTAGPRVALSDPAAAKPTFVAPPVTPAGARVTFVLTVADTGGLEDSSPVSLTVRDNGIEGFPEAAYTMTTPSGRPVGITLENGAELVRFSRLPEVRGRVVFIEDYDMAVATHLVQGVDV